MLDALLPAAEALLADEGLKGADALGKLGVPLKGSVRVP